MDVRGAQEFLRTNHHAVLSTFRSDGRAQLSPVSVALDAEDRVIVSTREQAVKVRNLRRDPRVSAAVFTDQFFGDWAQVEGTAEIVSLPEAMDGLIEYYRAASGEHPDWDDYRAAMRRDRRCLIRFDIERAGPNLAG
jgi:PPOX class probable F420-dependent enzyme